MPVMWMPVPVSVRAEEPAAREKPESRSVEAPSRTDGEADTYRGTVYDRSWRWGPVIVSPRRCAVRLNCLGAGVQAWSTSKQEGEHRQCYYYKFFSHVRYSLCCLAD